MNRHVAVMGFFAAALLMTGCNQPPPPVAATLDTREADTKAIHDIEDSWNKEYEAKDASKLVAHYADDATLMAPGMPASHGKDAIAKVLNEMAADKALALKFHADHVDVAKSGDLAVSQGSYEMTMTNPATKKPVHDKGSYVTVYRKIDGAWKAISDIATSEVMPMPSK